MVKISRRDSNTISAADAEPAAFPGILTVTASFYYGAFVRLRAGGAGAHGPGKERIEYEKTV